MELVTVTNGIKKTHSGSTPMMPKVAVNSPGAACAFVIRSSRIPQVSTTPWIGQRSAVMSQINECLSVGIMTLTADKVHRGMELVDFLLSHTDETSGYRSNQLWASTVPDTLGPDGAAAAAADDFLEALLAGSDTSSTPASPLWSPCTSDNGVSDDPLTDATHSPYAAPCSAFPAFDTQPFLQHPPLDNHLTPDDRKADVSIDIGWEAADLQDPFGITYYLSTNQSSDGQTVTVRDLLLSNLGQKSHRLHQDSLQELQLSEDEKRLLTKEGINLPSKLPLSKFEERVLKKIRRKIRNKRSAQESRKKKREYVDGLEGRMTTCSAHNLELQRKIQQLEETNNALLEQLSRLQARLPNGTNKTLHKGTCILVLLLSFSLIISSHLQPDPYSKLSDGEYTESKVPSRSLQSMEDERGVSPAALPFFTVSRGLEALCRLTEQLWPWKSLPAVDIASSPHKDRRSQDDH